MIEIPKTHVFPIETVEMIYEDARKFMHGNPRISKYSAAESFSSHSSTSYPFNFSGSLETGNYAVYLHEALKSRVTGFNCTTIIPILYLAYEAIGCKPEIVMFVDFEDKPTDPREKRKPYFFASHFSMIIDVGQKNRYLLDPYLTLFNPIVEQREGYLRIGKNGEIPALERNYGGIIPYTSQEFAELMERLRDPGESLDLLAAGQRAFHNRKVGYEDCNLMVYYDDAETKVTARLYIPQPGIMDKAVSAHHFFDPSGRTIQTTLDFLLAKNFAWDILKDPERVAIASFPAIRKLDAALRKTGSLVKYPRIGSRLLLEPTPLEEICSLSDGFMQDLTDLEKEGLVDRVLLRTLYEAEEPTKEYVYSEEKRDARLMELIAQYHQADTQKNSLEQESFVYGWKIRRNKNIEKRITRREQKINREITKICADMNKLLNLRYSNKHLYHRTMDKVLFADSLRDRTTEELQTMVRERNLDIRIGYLAMVSEFIPYVLSGRKHLELRYYIAPIREKIKARRLKQAAPQ